MSQTLPNTVIYHPKADLYREHLRRAVPDLAPVLVTRPSDLPEALPDTEILICVELSAEEAAKMGNLRWIQATSAGVERLLPARVHLRDVLITNARGIHSELMSDYVIAAMVMLQWNFPRILQDQAAKRWRREPKAALPGRRWG